MKDALRSAVATLVAILALAAGAASDPFTGRFIDEQRAIAIEIEFYDGVYSGVLTDGSSLFYELTAQAEGTRLLGEMISDDFAVPFYAENHGDFVVFTIEGVAYKFYPLDREPGTAPSPEQSAPAQQQPTEKQPARSAPQLSGAAGQIAGSRLYWSSKPSVISSSGGAYGEIDFCADGYFTDSSESSVGVQVQDYTGDTIASAGAASAGTYSGRWSVEQRDGQPSLVLQYGNGNTYYYYLSVVMTGSWRDGQWKYAMDWGKSRCR